MTRPPPLPLPVPFPVLGLAGDGHGPRTLALWNQPDWLWTVTLAHGAAADAVLVTTLRREPPPPWQGNSWEAVPNDLDAAVLDVVTSAVERAAGTDRAARRRLGEDIDAELDLVDVTDDGIVLHGWDDTDVTVDGTPVAARTRLIGGTRATVFGLPDVVVAVDEPSTAPNGLPLTLLDVRARLADYPWPGPPPA